MSGFITGLVAEDRSHRGPKQRPRRNSQRPAKTQQLAAQQEAQRQQQSDELQDELKHQERRYKETIRRLEEELSQKNAELQIMASRKMPVTSSILPDDMDEMAKLFILAEIFGKPPPGLS
jgi:uncharacterized protein YeaO (DUF488 family)